MDLDWIDAELCTVDQTTGNIEYVFERGTTPRAEYTYITCWIQANFDPKFTPEELWKRGKGAWGALSPENQMALWSLSIQEEQNAQDICAGLLATLADYQGLTVVKNAFREAIKSISNKFV
jgi:hypothetical protein